MFYNSKKIVTKFFFFLFIFFHLTQAMLSMEEEDLSSFDDRLSSTDKKTDKKRFPNKFTEIKTGFSPPKKQIKKESSSFGGLQKEPLSGGFSPIEELHEGLLEGLDDVQAMQVHILSSALHKEMRTELSSRHSNSLKNPQRSPFELDYKTLSPYKIKVFEELGGNLEDLEENAYQLKIEFPSPIRNPNYPSDLWYSPAARHAGVPRSLIKQGRDEGIICKLPIDYRIAPFTPETPEEREARKKQELIDYLEVAKLKGEISEEQIAEVLRQKGGGKSKEAIAAIKREIEIWQDHFNYIATRKERITGGTLELLDEDEFEDDGDDSLFCLLPEVGSDAEVDILDAQQNEGVKKIRKAEIEDAFENFVADNLIHLDVEGYDLWFSGEIDLDRKDQYGETNRERMSRGLCPIGADGETMNFHHLTHYDFKTHKIRSVIVLVTEYAHKTYSGNLHFGRNTYQDLPRKKVNRNEWNKVRMLFNKAIAEYFASLSK